MNCFHRIGVVTVLGVGLLAGCSKGDSAKSADTTGQQNSQTYVPVIKETDPNSNPAAKAAHGFLSAVLKGDTQLASSLITPQAMQRIIASGKQFSPPGIENATFKIGEIVSPSVDQAIVQCVLTDASQGAQHSEEMCCLLRRVNDTWLVSGIAYGTPDNRWILTDFETGQNTPIPNPGMSQMAGAPAGGQSQPPQAINPPIVAPPAPLGPPTAGPANVNSPNPNTAGLGMPAVGAPAGAAQPQAPYQPQPQYQPQPPYTAQEQQPGERR